MIMMTISSKKKKYGPYLTRAEGGLGKAARKIMLIALVLAPVVVDHQWILAAPGGEEKASARGTIIGGDSQRVVTVIKGKPYTLSQLKKEFPHAVHQLEKKIYAELQEITAKLYIKSHFESQGSKLGMSGDQAQEKFLADEVKISNKELKEYAARYRTHPSFYGRSEREVLEMVRPQLEGEKRSMVIGDLVNKAMMNNTIRYLWPQPDEVRYELVITDEDHVRYGPSPDDIVPKGCEGDSCQITVVEYSEFQCPYCAKVVDDVTQIMKEYQGKIRWIVRDFPLDFHDRAIPASIAAGCAGEQGKFWHMYYKLFENQRKLSDSDFVKYAKGLGIYNAKFKDCQANADGQLARIDRSMASAKKLEVSGTPGFFINGKRFSGVIPYAIFKSEIEAALAEANPGGAS